jgi:hypothetical protein
MKIYNYHPYYKYFISCTDADESPLEPGVFLIPAHATDIEPANCEDYEIQVFTENGWEIITNHSGTYFDTNTQEQFEWNNPFEKPENGTKTFPPEVEEGFALIWQNDDWSIIESKAGIYYNILTGLEIINEDPFNEPQDATREKPPQAPEGYGVIWNDGWELIEMPKPEPLTPQQKLEAAGLTVEELKELLGLQ